MQNIVMTQLTVSEIKQIFREELESFYTKQPAQNNQPDVDQLLTIQEAGEFLHLSVATLYALSSRKEIPSMKKGKRLYFSKSELIDWIKTGKQKTVNEMQNEANTYTSARKQTTNTKQSKGI